MTHSAHSIPSQAHNDLVSLFFKREYIMETTSIRIEIVHRSTGRPEPTHESCHQLLNNKLVIPTCDLSTSRPSEYKRNVYQGKTIDVSIIKVPEKAIMIFDRIVTG